MFYCGIDVAKRKHAVVILDDHGQVKKAVFETKNTRAGMDHLLEELQHWGSEVCVGLEATGHYWLVLILRCFLCNSKR